MFTRSAKGLGGETVGTESVTVEKGRTKPWTGSLWYTQTPSLTPGPAWCVPPVGTPPTSLSYHLRPTGTPVIPVETVRHQAPCRVSTQEVRRGCLDTLKSLISYLGKDDFGLTNRRQPRLVRGPVTVPTDAWVSFRRCTRLGRHTPGYEDSNFLGCFIFLYFKMFVLIYVSTYKLLFYLVFFNI